MPQDLLEIERIGDGACPSAEPVRTRVVVRRSRAAVSIITALAGVLVGASILAALARAENDPAAERAPSPAVADPSDPDVETLEPALGSVSTVDPLLAVERFVAAPNRDRLRDLFEAVGGFDGVRIGQAEGSFDVVGFDPADPNRLFAARRLSYGPAANQRFNEVWTIDGSADIAQALWEPEVDHDFAHFNVDGTITMWVHGGGDGYAPRIAVVLDGVSREVIFTTVPMYASRFTATARAVFALTDTGTYGTNQSGYVDLVADAGDGPVVLADGEPFGWIDTPTPGLLVAYPATADGTTAVWDAVTLQQLSTHPLAGRTHARVAVSGDRRTAVAASADGDLEIIDLATGRVQGRFGRLDPEGVSTPITLNHDGTVAVTVDRSGLVQIWWVGDDEPVASFGADAAQPRWIAEEFGPRSTSAVATDQSRVALRIGARPGVATRWEVVETDITAWIARACRLAGLHDQPAEPDDLDATPVRQACRSTLSTE